MLVSLYSMFYLKISSERKNDHLKPFSLKHETGHFIYSNIAEVMGKKLTNKFKAKDLNFALHLGKQAEFCLSRT